MTPEEILKEGCNSCPPRYKGNCGNCIKRALDAQKAQMLADMCDCCKCHFTHEEGCRCWDDD